MTHRPTGPACGNNPNYRMSDGDRQAVENFKAYLADRAALQRVRAVLETEAVLGRSALEYRGLIASALMADEAQQPAPKPVATPSNRRALVHNAITDALSTAGDWVPLSIRIAATRAALAEVDAWHASDPAPVDEAQGGAQS